MINTFVYPNYKSLFKIFSYYLKKEYKENLNMITINIQNEYFEKLINLFEPQKITYEKITFYTKSSEPIKEMVNSDFNLFIFNSKEEMYKTQEDLKNRDIKIIQEYLQSRSVQKNPSIKPKIEEIFQFIQKYPSLTEEELLNINIQYYEIITLLSLVSIKKNFVILDVDYNNELPLSLVSEIIELPIKEAEEFINLYKLPPIDQKVKKMVTKITSTILKYWVIFYTGNKKEVKQYLVPLNTDVLTASAKIHTDIAKKFIQAEVCNIQDMKNNKLPPFKSFGKNYIVQNHDFLSIKTS